MNHQAHNTITAGTTGGTILSIIMSIHPGDLLKTSVLAATGAMVSFLVSLLMGQVVRWYKHRSSNKH
ncbi:hypothetical protein D3H65_01350 [Paraflavitalea soli]|uniref:Uncharacterized protein n=1 Tax=Paraflavitalea soli TaxID=2315862 RepID=A0A3B7MV95_9BACT|nr:hypothetical protein [Paraflavitalea soli]AXY78472.1 hypothetical protein D3H65_01350 [Paraflavitalea soli]